MHVTNADSSRRLSITAVGDMMFDQRLQPPRVFYYHPAVTACIPGLTFPGVPFVNTEENRTRLASDASIVDGICMTSHLTDSHALDLPDASDVHYPFAMVCEELRRSDLLFGNLECPLSDNGRRTRNDQCFSASPRFAESLASVPFHVISFANNHCMDYGEVAFGDTIRTLRARGIAVIGAGGSLDEARQPARFCINGVAVAFLGYTLLGPDAVFSCATECGAAALNPVAVQEDVERIRADVDLVVVSAHWGAELMASPWPWLVAFAHRLIDCGVDVLLGHHPHVPGAIEVYRNRLICYSLGNFCFGHGHSYWADNMIVRIDVAGSAVRNVEVTPITGTYQPRLVDSVAAAAFHERLVQLSGSVGTVLEFVDGRSHVAVGRQ